MTLHTYTYVQSVKTDRGHKFQLRRDDGKRVYVSRKRLNELANAGRIKTHNDHVVVNVIPGT